MRWKIDNSDFLMNYVNVEIIIAKNGIMIG